MISEKKLIKLVTRELIKNPVWKVIVRGNSWLCPFCGEIGVRRLSMNEHIEGRIASHLRDICEVWKGPKTPAIDLKDLKRKAKLAVFKMQVSRWILEDRRFSMASEDRRWFCPFCAELSAIILPEGDPRDASSYDRAVERDPFITEVARHFLSCGSFERDDLKSQPELDERKAKIERQGRNDELLRRFESAPEWRLFTGAGRWLCPYCAELTSARRRGPRLDDEFLGGLNEHLLICRRGKELGEPRPLSYLEGKLAGLRRERRLDRLRKKIGEDPLWRCMDSRRRWFCPCCGERTDIAFPVEDPPRGEALEGFVNAVLDHLRRCKTYRSEGGLKALEDMLVIVEKANRRLKKQEVLRSNLRNDGRFLISTADRTWICPYCVAPARSVELDPARFSIDDELDFARFADRALAHLDEECPQYREGTRARATLAEIQSEATNQSPDVTNAFVGVSDLSDEWEELKRQTEELNSSRAGRDPSGALELAKATRRRLLPRIPELPGLELATLHLTCDAVGGDFFDIFPVSARVWAFTLGSVSGRGVRAELGAGLTKKIIQQNAGEGRSCRDTLISAGRDLTRELEPRTSVSVFFALLNVDSLAFQFTQARMRPLLLANPQRSPTLSPLSTPGPSLVAGVEPSQALEQRGLRLAAGDVLMAYTEGLARAPDLEGRELGDARLRELVEGHAFDEAEYLLWKVKKTALTWSATRKLPEDITALAIKISALRPEEEAARAATSADGGALQ